MAKRSMTFCTMTGAGKVVRLAGFASLEEDIGVLGRAAKNGAVGAECALAEGDEVLIVHHRADGFVGEGSDLGDFMRGAETVKEMQERNARFQRGDLRDQRQVVHFLHGVRREHRPTGGAARHDVGVITEDGQRMRGQRACGYMHYAG